MSKIFGYIAVGALFVGWISVAQIGIHLARSVQRQGKSLYQPFAVPGTLASPATTQEHQDENR